MTLGREDEFNIVINGEIIDSYSGVEIEKRLNEVDTFNFTAHITDDEQRGLISEGNDVLFLEDQELVFKGRLEDVSYDSEFQVECEGEGMENRLLDRKTDRDQYDNLPADEIVEDLAEPTPLEIGELDEAPLTSLSFDHDNRARAVAGAANAVGYDWEIRQDFDDDYETDYLDFKERIGEEEPVYDFVLGDTARFVDDENDDGFVANDITMLGRGDGVNQLETRLYAAADSYARTMHEIDEDEDEIEVSSIVPLGSEGDTVIVRVGTELIKGELEILLSPLDSDSAGGLIHVDERGVEDWNSEETPVIKHREGVSVWLYENLTEEKGPYTPESQETAQEGSSIAEKGVKQLRETDKTIVNLSTLEQVADRELRNRHREVKSIEIRPTNPRIEDKVSLGDTVYIDDGDGQLDDEYRVVGKDITRRTSGEGTVLHCANRPMRLVERLSEIERDRDTLNAHMQGSTNVDSQSFRDNCDEDNPLETNVYVPSDAVAVNKIELVMKREAFRGYVQNQSHVHEIDDTTPGAASELLKEGAASPGETPDEITAFGLTEGDIFDEELTIDFVDDDEISVSNIIVYINAAVTTGSDNEPQLNMVVENTDKNERIIDKTRFVDPGRNTMLLAGYVDEDMSQDELVFSIEVTEDQDESHTISMSYGFVAFADHVHEIDATSEASGEPVYGIFQESDEDDVDVTVKVDGEEVETLEDVSVGQEVTDEIRLEEDLSEPITGQWHSVELVPTGLTRLTANVLSKIYVESQPED